MRMLFTVPAVLVAQFGTSSASAASNVHAFGVGGTVVASCTITAQTIAQRADAERGNVCTDLLPTPSIAAAPPRVIVSRDDPGQVTLTIIEF